MKDFFYPSGRQQGIPFLIATDWTPAEALAVIELLDDLRERIWAHYEWPLCALIRAQRLPPARTDDPDTLPDDPPF